MPIPTVVTITGCLTFLVWWHFYLKRAVSSSVALTREETGWSDKQHRSDSDKQPTQPTTRPRGMPVGPRFSPIDSKSWYIGLAFGGLAIVACVFLVWLRVDRTLTATPSAGSVLVSGATPKRIVLRDGSTLDLDAETRLHLTRDDSTGVDVELANGKANFDVTHLEGRAFEVHAGTVRISVVGTRFEVARNDRHGRTHIQVAVARGLVEVRQAGTTARVRRLNAGETWEALIPDGTQTTRIQPDAGASERAVESLPSDLSPSSSSPRERAENRPVTDGVTRKAGEHIRDDKKVRKSAAAELFERANLARRTGRTRDAADAYEELLRRFPDNFRAGLIAFELGRIRMDALNQPRAAVEAFILALRVSPRASFREDALARIVFASDQLGDRGTCTYARQRYLKDFPNGVHSAALTSRCGGP
jgi:hypothetical protein